MINTPFHSLFKTDVKMYDFFKPQDGWVELPSMNEGRAFHGCGLATKGDGTQLLVVVGNFWGEKTAEAYEFGVDGSTWM